MMRIILIISIFIMLLFTMAYADRGSIPFVADAKVFEPTQRALIAWDGKEEILLLSTDMSTSKPTKVLEVLPLPSEPIVAKGDVEVFKKAIELINRKLRYLRKYGVRDMKAAGMRSVEELPAGEVTFHEKIGAHDISVTHVLNSNGFIEWVEEYLASAGVDNPKIPGVLKKVVSEYLNDNFTWFVFDVIELDEVPKTNEAIQYRFTSEKLYYPLRITQTNEGYTTITLLILTPQLLSDFSGIQEVKLLHEPVDITAKELQEISEEMYNLLGKPASMKLRIWEIKGKLSSFDKDLIASGFVSLDVSD